MASVDYLDQHGHSDHPFFHVHQLYEGAPAERYMAFACPSNVQTVMNA
jgi:hypothetical protein